LSVSFGKSFSFRIILLGRRFLGFPLH
jgi:hypothetical protein